MGWDGEHVTALQAWVEDNDAGYRPPPTKAQLDLSARRKAERARCKLGQHRTEDLIRGFCPWCGGKP
jgi:hypothetical protein